METNSVTHPTAANEQEHPPRVLVFSQRNLSTIQPFRCAHFEFEDVIAAIDSVDFLAPHFNVATRRYSFAKQLAYNSPFRINPGVPPAAIRPGYDLFLAICGNPTDLLHVHALGDWRSKCRTAVCLIDELWVTQMERYDSYLRMLDQFDIVVLYYSQSIEPLNKRIGRKSIFLPPGVDALHFCPGPNPPSRAIDVYSVGRRSAVTHQSLLETVANDGFFYLYDSTSADRVLDPSEHRQLFANILKRSRYFIVNPGLIDRRDVRGDQIEIGNRYFEGAAAGSIMVGARPDNGEFEGFFDWPDALIDLPYDSPDFLQAIGELERDPMAQDDLRRMNVRQSLLRHDWMYRWEAILAAAGISPAAKLEERKKQLRATADTIAQNQPLRVIDAPESVRSMRG